LKARDAARAGQLLGQHVRRTGETVAETLTKRKETP
jgi:DNA-binding GntR family transcriptional regulator